MTAKHTQLLVHIAQISLLRCLVHQGLLAIWCCLRMDRFCEALRFILKAKQHSFTYLNESNLSCRQDTPNLVSCRTSDQVRGQHSGLLACGFTWVSQQQYVLFLTSVAHTALSQIAVSISPAGMGTCSAMPAWSRQGNNMQSHAKLLPCRPGLHGTMQDHLKSCVGAWAHACSRWAGPHMGSWLHGNPCRPVYFHGRLGPMQSRALPTHVLPIVFPWGHGHACVRHPQ